MSVKVENARGEVIIQKSHISLTIVSTDWITLFRSANAIENGIK